MIEINLFDSNFPGQACSVATQTPQLMRYVRNVMDWPGITVFTDNFMYSPIVDDVQSKYKIGWLHEARSLHPENYERIGEVAHKFNAIMTHDADLLASGSYYYYSPGTPMGPFMKTIRGGSWVPLEAWGMYPKTKNVAMILSEKSQLEGHQLRHAIAAAGLPIDLYGPQHTPIGHDKALAYKDHRFAVVVEACKEDNFFSEHLVDALAYGCVPIYWGCPNIGLYFDIAGIIRFDDVIGLFDRLAWANEQAYMHMAPALIVNQALARFYAITEDWQVEHCLRPFLEAA